ncbi:hypothetical protein ACFT9I_29050 [Streptomyces sp. NPDC057137]|uniref:hypothetical protein n=1 Tax=Streptomyces sp. NPDC057137 TaxID=3346030 RepID=UPI003625129A
MVPVPVAVPVHALAHRPLTVAAVAELVALPTAPLLPDNDFDTVDAELRRRGWRWEHELVCDSYRAGHGHVLCTDGVDPFGHPDARHFLVFGELYPVDPDDESVGNGPWLYDLMDQWREQPGWSERRPATYGDCEAVLAEAARAVTEHLGTAPERTIVSSAAVVTGHAMTHRVWRTSTHALVLGPAADNGPYGYLTHLQLSYTPLACGPELPAARDADDADAVVQENDEAGLAKWITAHVDW